MQFQGFTFLFFSAIIRTLYCIPARGMITRRIFEMNRNKTKTVVILGMMTALLLLLRKLLLSNFLRTESRDTVKSRDLAVFLC